MCTFLLNLFQSILFFLILLKWIFLIFIFLIVHHKGVEIQLNFFLYIMIA